MNEEIDALSTLGISPMEFLVLPRLLALVLMMPLLCLYANLLGILGGIVVGTGILDLTLVAYMTETRQAVTLTDFAIGLFKAGMFGILVAVAGCLRGMQCGRSAQAVGAAATSAVVMGIVSIIVADGLFAVLLDALGLSPGQAHDPEEGRHHGLSRGPHHGARIARRLDCAIAR